MKVVCRPKSWYDIVYEMLLDKLERKTPDR